MNNQLTTAEAMAIGDAKRDEWMDIANKGRESMTNNQFKREDRYLVLKITDIDAALKRGLMSREDIEALKKVATAVEESRQIEGKAEFGCAVVERDWPEYEPVWAMIEARVTGAKQ